MFQQFTNREKELKILEELYKQKANLFILYGRRRVGKTELIKRFFANKSHIYYLADERDDFQNLKEFQRIMGDHLKNELFKKADIKSWLELFEEFTKLNKEKLIVTIDEFPYLIKSNKAMPSLFQKIWDLNLSKRSIFLVLLGSSISMMENYTLNYKSPLYGRRTGQLKLQPLKFKYLKKFFPNKSVEELVKFYALSDGIPLYLLKLDKNLSFFENLEQRVFRVGEFLYQEAEILLKQELREVARYFNILKAIAAGKQKYGEIVNFTQLEKSLVSKYLENLLQLHVIKKEFPVTQKKELRNANYVFEDNYFNFWFRFVYPYKSLVEEDKQEVILKQIDLELNLYFSLIFEKICYQALWSAKLPFVPMKIGRWWYKDKEIDLVALDDKSKKILFCECKWQTNVDAGKVLRELKEKSNCVDWHKGKREEYFCVFAKGFKRKEKNLCLFDLKDIERMFKL